MDRDALEPRRLLKAVADTAAGPLRDGHVRHVLAVIQYAAGRGLHQSHDNLGQRGLAAAVGAGEHHQLVVGNGDGDVFENVLLPIGSGYAITDILQFQHECLSPL